MSLFIYFSDEVRITPSVITDVDAEFIRVKKTYSEYVSKMVAEIDKGVLSPSMLNFIDRFGNTIPVGFLSSGCKTAILLQYTETPIYAIECGVNALQSIICNAVTGHIIIQFPYYPIPYGNIDVMLHDKHFTSGEALSNYIKYECF